MDRLNNNSTDSNNDSNSTDSNNDSNDTPGYERKSILGLK
jgi:hypothetical protein